MSREFTRGFSPASHPFTIHLYYQQTICNTTLKPSHIGFHWIISLIPFPFFTIPLNRHFCTILFP